jgi:hypothetical protein
MGGINKEKNERRNTKQMKFREPYTMHKYTLLAEFITFLKVKPGST